MIVDFMKGHMIASLPGGLNVVAVEDVARAHVLALEKGEPGRRYLIGGTNLTLQELWAQLAEICGRPAPQLAMPFPVALAIAWCDELRCRLMNATPVVPLEGVYMGREKMFVSSERASRELGLSATPVPAALERSVRWFRDQGYVS
jgi:dihydroflavonol-4-reductase